VAADPKNNPGASPRVSRCVRKRSSAFLRNFPELPDDGPVVRGELRGATAARN
jgi:hypothetical protein